MGGGFLLAQAHGVGPFPKFLNDGTRLRLYTMPLPDLNLDLDPLVFKMTHCFDNWELSCNLPSCFFLFCWKNSKTFSLKILCFTKKVYRRNRHFLRRCLPIKFVQFRAILNELKNRRFCTSFFQIYKIHSNW